LEFRRVLFRSPAGRTNLRSRSRFSSSASFGSGRSASDHRTSIAQRGTRPGPDPSTSTRGAGRRGRVTFGSMPQTVRGVIARAKGEPVTVENVIVPDPGPGEAVVQIQACG